MAFKREGDDLSQLNALRKRRVADLLASYIPEDEAILMKNGRYACSICFSRPVFDTVDMLAVHRTGKKHVAGLQRFYSKKRGLQLEIQKRRHQEHVREEELGAGGQQAPLLSETRRIAHHVLLKAAPYNSCCKRNWPRSDDHTATPGHSKTTPSNWQSPAGGVTELPRVAEGSWTTDTQPTTSLQAEEHKQADNANVATSGRRSHVERAAGTKKKGRRKSQATPPPAPADPEKQKLAEHYLKLRSAGWIPDGCGRWTRDEAAEFDSDEEEPPPLPLP
ncbi:sodium channel modifier 1 [Cetorhinus maximus]